MSPLDSLTDAYGRPITYLRLSVTDRCQFRCLYCVPPEGLTPSPNLMNPDEMERLIRALVGLDVSRVRLTGGEPLLRKDIVSLVARFSSIPGVRDLALTTNGEQLAPLVSDLRQAGLKRINISLDTLDDDRFFELTSSRSFLKVWQGILRSIEEGLDVKINVVLLKGISDEEIDGFARLAYSFPLEVRFIEFMPLCGSGWKPELMVPIRFVRSRLRERYDLRSLPRGSEVAESYELAGGKGRVGFIGSMTEPFCGACSRIRITSAGRVQLCLFSPVQYDLLPTLRREASLEEIQDELRRLAQRKPKQHPFVGESANLTQAAHGEMQSIGG